MDSLQQSLDPARIAFNAYMGWADTPGAILTLLLLPAGVLLAIIGKLLDMKSSYWRRT